jgi:hypothetical protein
MPPQVSDGATRKKGAKALSETSNAVLLTVDMMREEESTVDEIMEDVFVSTAQLRTLVGSAPGAVKL